MLTVYIIKVLFIWFHAVVQYIYEVYSLFVYIYRLWPGAVILNKTSDQLFVSWQISSSPRLIEHNLFAKKSVGYSLLKYLALMLVIIINLNYKCGQK